MSNSIAAVVGHQNCELFQCCGCQNVLFSGFCLRCDEQSGCQMLSLEQGATIAEFHDQMKHLPKQPSLASQDFFLCLICHAIFSASA